MIWIRFDSQTWLHIVTTSKSLKNTPANHGWLQKHDIEQKKKKKKREREPETMKPTLYDSILIPSGQAKEKKFYEVKN